MSTVYKVNEDHPDSREQMDHQDLADLKDLADLADQRMSCHCKTFPRCYVVEALTSDLADQTATSGVSLSSNLLSVNLQLTRMDY